MRPARFQVIIFGPPFSVSYETLHLAWILYEYFITFDQEVAAVWQRKLTGPSVLLLLERWSLLLQSVMNVIPPYRSDISKVIRLSRFPLACSSRFV